MGITVPLQMIEFNLILRAANKPTSSAGFWKLLVGTVVMLSFGYAGEIDVFPAPAGGLALRMAWLDGASSSTRSSMASLVATPMAALRLLQLPSTTCARSSQWAGPSTLLGISL